MDNLKNLEERDTVHLFWSGGWDSTFRLLQLLLIEKRKVQPHYMIWTGDVVGETVKAMLNIRSKILSDYPDTKELLLPINYFDEQSVKPNKKIMDAFYELEETRRVGRQHALLALFCEQNNYRNVEQGSYDIFIGNKNQTFNKEDYLTNFRVDREKTSKPVYDLYKYFKFPLVKMEKKEMDDIALEHGWEDIMYMTWFCRRPRNGRPCGFCGNCTDTLIHGMGKRLPLRARIIAYLQLPFRKWWRKNYEKRQTGIYKYIKRMLQNRA